MSLWRFDQSHVEHFRQEHLIFTARKRSFGQGNIFTEEVASQHASLVT